MKNVKGFKGSWPVCGAFLFVFLFVFAYAVPSVHAHFSTVGYSEITLNEDSVDYSLYLDPQEVGQWFDLYGGKKVFVIDANEQPKEQNQGYGWERSQLEQLVSSFLTVKNDGTAGKPQLQSAIPAKRGDAEYIRIDVKYPFDRPIRDYEIGYRFFFDDIDPKHQNFAEVRSGQKVSNKVFDQANRTLAGSIAAAGNNTSAGTELSPDWVSTAWTYTVMGMKHIWAGYDHLLFLLGLVILRQKKRDYLKILTAFTVGHSITLALSALNIFTISLRIIEPLIALSIVYIAVENMLLKRPYWRWALALLFGLVHGFGFADILRGALGDRFVLSLFSFNIGVELGQLAVWIVLLPLLWLLLRVRWYPALTRSVSGVIGCFGLVWFIQRVFGG